MKRTSTVLAVVAAIAVLVYAMSWLWRGWGGASPSGPAAERIASSGPAASSNPARSQGASTQPASRNAAPLELTDEYFEKMAADIAETIQPLRWRRPEFDGKTELTPEELAKVKAVTDRHFSNFQRIGSIRMRAKQTITQLVDSEKTRQYLAQRRGINSFDLEIIAMRKPQYFAMRGRRGDVQNFREIITPAGKFSSGQVGMGESFIPTYLDGEMYFLEGTLLRFGHLREGVAWTLPAPSPEFESYLNNQPQARYNVIEVPNRVDGYLISCWFNAETGLLERVVGQGIDNQDKPNRLASLVAIEYAPSNGVQYVKRAIILDNEIGVRHDFTTEDMSIRPLDSATLPDPPTEGK